MDRIYHIEDVRIFREKNLGEGFEKEATSSTWRISFKPFSHDNLGSGIFPHVLIVLFSVLNSCYLHEVRTEYNTCNKYGHIIRRKRIEEDKSCRKDSMHPTRVNSSNSLF